MGVWRNLLGTLQSKFQVGLGGPQIKNNSGVIEARNAADSTYAAIAASLFKTYGDDFELNSDATDTGADWKMTLRRPSTGMTESITIVPPATAPATGQALTVASFAAGVVTLQYTTIAAGNDKPIIETTALAFGSTSPVAMFTLPSTALIRNVRVTIDTPFDGTPSMSVGIAGTTSKYVSSTQVDLAAAATTVFEVTPGLPAAGASEALIITYAAGAATAGAARVEVEYVVQPS